MRTELKTLLLAVSLSFGMVCHAQNSGITYRGFTYCGEWVKSRKTTVGTVEGFSKLNVEAKLVAFLSGLAVGTQNDFLKDSNLESLYLWMDIYCEKNPLSNSYEGASALALELSNKRRGN